MTDTQNPEPEMEVAQLNMSHVMELIAGSEMICNALADALQEDFDASVALHMKIAEQIDKGTMNSVVIGALMQGMMSSALNIAVDNMPDEPDEDYDQLHEMRKILTGVYIQMLMMSRHDAITIKDGKPTT